MDLKLHCQTDEEKGGIMRQIARFNNILWKPHFGIERFKFKDIPKDKILNVRDRFLNLVNASNFDLLN
jgi:hypothetical protein